MTACHTCCHTRWRTQVGFLVKSKERWKDRQVDACHTLHLRETTSSQQRSTAQPDDSHIKQTWHSHKYWTVQSCLLLRFKSLDSKPKYRVLIVRWSDPCFLTLKVPSSKGYCVSVAQGRRVQAGGEVQTTWSGHPGWRIWLQGGTFMKLWRTTFDSRRWRGKHISIVLVRCGR